MSSGKTPFFPEPSDGPNLKGMCYVIWIIVLELSPLGIIKLPFIDSVVLLIDNVLGNHLWVTASTWNVKMLTWKITQIICACRGVNILLIVFSEFIPVWMRLLVTFLSFQMTAVNVKEILTFVSKQCLTHCCDLALKLSLVSHLCFPYYHISRQPRFCNLWKARLS